MTELSEVAPPTKKHERMVKHIKKSYKEDGKLTDNEKSIAYATAWKDYNKDKVSEGASILKVRGKRNTSLVATGDHRRDKEGNIKASFYDKKPAPQGEKGGKRIGRKNKSPRYGSQLHRLRPKSERGYRSEGVALGKTRSTDTNTKGWKARVSSGKGMTLTKAGGLGKSKPKNMDSIVAKYKEQVKSDRRAAAKERRITEGVKSAIEKVLAARKKRKESKKHDYGRDAGAEAAQKLRDKDHKKYVNFLPANK